MVELRWLFEVDLRGLIDSLPHPVTVKVPFIPKLSWNRQMNG